MHSAGAVTSGRNTQHRLLQPERDPQPVGARVVALARLAAAVHMARAADAARADADAPTAARTEPRR